MSEVSPNLSAFYPSQHVQLSPSPFLYSTFLHLPHPSLPPPRCYNNMHQAFYIVVISNIGTVREWDWM